MLVKVGSIWLNPERVAFVHKAATGGDQTQVWFSGVEGENADYWVVEQPVEEVVEILSGAAGVVPPQPRLVELPAEDGAPFMLAPAEVASVCPHETRNTLGVIHKRTWITMRGGSDDGGGGAEYCVGLPYEETKRRLGLA